MSAPTAAPVLPGARAADAPVATRTGLAIAIAVARILMGFYFFWAFVDKMFGLGFATPAERAWINGGNPTLGYLSGATESPLASVFAAIAGNPIVNVIFMAGLLGVGVALMLGIGVRIGTIAGAAMLFFMYLAKFPLTLTGANNPIMDSHITDITVMAIVFFGVYGQLFSLAPKWREIVGDKTWLW
ncbi:hypothetical protein [Microbacterium sp. NPDC076911]|uniref:hypothetical protein n=1 Tax=Microbacterium sp. NPDC076911 TaxID=3154958 RepID=UPI0034368E9A